MDLITALQITHYALYRSERGTILIQDFSRNKSGYDIEIRSDPLVKVQHTKREQVPYLDLRVQGRVLHVSTFQEVENELTHLVEENSTDWLPIE